MSMDTKDNEMIQTQPGAASAQLDKRIFYTVIGLTVFETILVTLALVPPQEWTRLLPGSTSAALDGPFPAALYLVPTLIGFLCRSWQRALLFATLPAWIGLALFVMAAASKVGAFYLVSSTQVTSNVSVLELFAALGGIGWLARHLFKLKF